MATIGSDLPREKITVGEHVRFFCMQAGCGEEQLHFLLLPELNERTASRWWKGAIEEMLERRFPQLLKQPVWARELKKVSSGTEADMRKELKKIIAAIKLSIRLVGCSSIARERNR